jgi:hypothetical protein
MTAVRTPAEVLRAAVGVLRQRGLAKGACVDPCTGAVDVTGALQMACGVRRSDLTDDLFEAMAVVPQANLPGFAEAWTALDAIVDGLEDWQDAQSTSVDDAVALMSRVAADMERRVTNP